MSIETAQTACKHLQIKCEQKHITDSMSVSFSQAPFTQNRRKDKKLPAHEPETDKPAATVTDTPKQTSTESAKPKPVLQPVSEHFERRNSSSASHMNNGRNVMASFFSKLPSSESEGSTDSN